MVKNNETDIIGYCMCKVGFYDVGNGKCDEKPQDFTCQGPTYVEVREFGAVCISCHESCDECTGPAASQCTMCNSDRVFTPAAVSKTYVGDINGTCNCKAGTDPFYADPDTGISTVCLTAACPDGFYKDYTDGTRPGGKCEPCNDACATCYERDDWACLTCNEPYYMPPWTTNTGSKYCECAPDY